MGQTSRLQVELFRKIYEAWHYYFVETWRQDFIKFLFEKLDLNQDQRTNDLLLDIGCGVGHIVIQASLQGTSSIGVDISRLAIEKARDFAKKQFGGNVNRPEFLLCDAQYLPFRKGVFSIITSIQVIEHLADDKKAIEDIAWVAKSGCRIFVSTVNAMERIPPQLRLLYYIHEKRAGHLRGYKAEDLIKMCKEKKLLPADVIYYTHLFKLIQDFFCATFPVLRRANSGLWRRVTALDLVLRRVPTGWTFGVIFRKVCLSETYNAEI